MAMELGSPESLRSSIMDLQNTLANVGADPMFTTLQNMDQDFNAPHFVMEGTAKVVPISDFLGWEKTGAAEHRWWPTYDKLLTKKLAYWVTGHGTVPLLLDAGVLQWKADDMKTPGTGILRASQFTLPAQIRLKDSEVYFLQNPRMSHSEGGLVMNKPYVGFYKTTSTSGEPLLQALLSQRTDELPRGSLGVTQFVCNDWEPSDLDEHAYRLTSGVLRSYPFLMSTIENENLLVASGTSQIELMHRSFDETNRTCGLQTGTAYHAKKQDPDTWRRRAWTQTFSRWAGKICNW